MKKIISRISCVFRLYAVPRKEGKYIYKIAFGKIRATSKVANKNESEIC